MYLEIKEPRGEILRHPARHKTLATGRRWGKTHLAIIWMNQGDLLPGRSRWFVAPTYKQAKLIAWPIMKKMHKEWGWFNHISYSETDLTATFPNGHIHALHGADNEDRLRGVGLDRVVLEEYAFMKPHVWGEIIRPMLSDYQGESMRIGTPDGFNHFYDHFVRGQDKNFPDWMSWQFKTIEGGYITEEEIEAAKRDMDARQFRQEYEASFETASNRIYDAFDRSRNVIERPDLKDKGLPLIAGMDFNVSKMCCAIGYQLIDGIHWFDEIVLRDSNTFEMASQLSKRYPRIRVTPDASGGARRSSATKTDHQILRDHGLSVICHRANPHEKDRINAVNGLWYNAKGKTRMTVEPQCIEIISDFERTIRRGDGSIDKRDMERTHMSDAVGYPVEYLFPIKKRGAVALPRY
jgi:hypothetical protein